jgi:hypothetical protein
VRLGGLVVSPHGVVVRPQGGVMSLRSGLGRRSASALPDFDPLSTRMLQLLVRVGA